MITAVRFTPASLRCMIQDHICLESDAFYWQHITHLVFAGLNYDYGQVSVGAVTDDEIEAGALTHPATYVPWLKQLQVKWPHLKIVWSLPPFEDDDDLEMYDFSRVEHLAKVYGMDAIEVNMQYVIRHKAAARRLLKTLSKIEVKWWLVLPNVWSGLWSYSADMTVHGPNIDFVDVFLLAKIDNKLTFL